MSDIDTPPEQEPEAVDEEDLEHVEDPEIPLVDAVEQHTPVTDEDEDAEKWVPVPDGIDPADATEQRRPIGHPEDEDYR